MWRNERRNSWGCRGTTRRVGNLLAGLLCGVLGAVAMVGMPADADACEPGYCIEQMNPADGAAGVSTDANVWVWYEGGASAGPEVTLKNSSNGEVVETERTREEFRSGSDFFVAFAPDQRLRENTTYEVIFDGIAVCGPPEGKTFTTGEATATSPKAPMQPSGNVSCDTRRRTTVCPQQNGPGESYPVHSFSVDVEMQQEVFGYAVSRDDGRFPEFSRTLPVRFDHPTDEGSESECYTVRAVNEAGDVSKASEEVCFDTAALPCSGAGDVGMDTETSDVGDTSADTGGTPDSDVGGPSDGSGLQGSDNSSGSTEAESGTSGCGCESTGTGGGAPVVILVVLFVGMRCCSSKSYSPMA